MLADPAIVVSGLTKSYGTVEAVRGVDLTVERGEIYALLGPNGAGKTTIVEILEGHREPTAGDVRVMGFDPRDGGRPFRSLIGIVLQETGVERYLTVAEVIEQFRGFYPHPRALNEIIELVGLGDKRNARVRRLSGGQKRRLDVAIGLAGNPDLLFLDEPTTGFDPSARRDAWQLVHSLRDLGKTVLLTTHYMDEAQNLADRVGVIVSGRIVAEGPPATIGGRDTQSASITFHLTGDVRPPDGFGFEIIDGVARLSTDHPTPVLHELTRWALANDVELGGLEVSQPTLEDVYLALAAEPLDEASDA